MSFPQHEVMALRKICQFPSTYRISRSRLYIAWSWHKDVFTSAKCGHNILSQSHELITVTALGTST